MSKARESSKSQRVLTVIGIVLCVILLPILIMNVSMIIQSYINKDEVPSIGSVVPMIVLTDSMDPEIKGGDLILCEKVDATEIQERDIISFFDPAGNGSSVVTHRVIGIIEQDGKLFFRTKGDNNNTEDRLVVPAENLVGRYKLRLPAIGHVAMFMSTTAGLIICVIVPMVLLVGYDLLRRRLYEKNKQDDTDALLAELEALKAEKAAREAAAQTTATTTDQAEAENVSDTDQKQA
ncbi:MAG: signal peptidase I [Clostridia bacterium]|nr:signal peptidase I [Clostridia bacterium]